MRNKRQWVLLSNSPEGFCHESDRGPPANGVAVSHLV
jgi:hypothetical protein